MSGDAKVCRASEKGPLIEADRLHPDSASPKVFVVVLNWNGWEDTSECLESLRSVTYPDAEILVVDNGSTDGSRQKLAAAFPEILVLKNEKNIGYSGGNNRGLRYCFLKGAEYVILLNNDTVVEPTFVTELVLAAESETRPGLLSSKIFFYDRPQRLWFAGGTFSLLSGRSTHVGFNEPDDGRYGTITETERACGCSLMVSRDFCETVGLLNEDYFCYCEETDWSLRGKRAGFRNLFIPKSMVYHKVSKSTGGSQSGNYLYYSVRNTLKCLDENDPSVFGFVRASVVFSVYVLSLLTMGIPKFRGMNAILSGFRDYLLKRTGEWT